MSHVKSLVGNIEQSIIEKEKKSEFEEMSEAIEKRKYNVTGRFDCMQVQYLDILAKKTDMSRSSLVVELATSALMDVMEEMDLTQSFFDDLVGQTQYEKEGK